MQAFQVPLYALLSHVMMVTRWSLIQMLACFIIKDFLAKRINWNFIKEIVLPLSVFLGEFCLTVVTYQWGIDFRKK